MQKYIKEHVRIIRINVVSYMQRELIAGNTAVSRMKVHMDPIPKAGVVAKKSREKTSH